MKIENLHPNINFQKLKTIKNDDLNLFDDFSCRDKNYQVYTVNINKIDNDKLNITINDEDIFDQSSKEEIQIYNNRLIVNNMATKNSFQEKGLGTILHLANIIEMLENNLGSVNLFATATALPFHAKFGFYPDEMWEEGLYNNIVKLAKQKNPLYNNYSKRAAVLLARDIPLTEKAAIGNKIMYDYLQTILSQKNKLELLDEFEYGSDMVLDKNMIIANKNYYNNLLKKHCIDYEI